MIATAADVEVRTVIVRSTDGVRFIAAASDDDQLTSQLVEYVASRCEDVLWPSAAREVQELIAARRDADAVAAYFRNVGRRWDEEWME